MKTVLSSSFSGLAAAGTISVTEAEVGDQVLSVVNISNGQSYDHTDDRFSSVVLTSGEIFQLTVGGDLSGYTFQALLQRNDSSHTVSLSGTIS